MKIPTILPITAEQSRAARVQLGLTQAQVIEDSDLPGYKLKQFETGRFVPDVPFLQKLREFYTSRGIELGDPADTGTSTLATKNKAVSGALPFFLLNDLTTDELDAVFTRIDENIERINSILPLPVSEGFLGGWDEDTKAKQRELFGALAENFLLIARLQGKMFVSKPKDPPATQADLLALVFTDSLLNTLASDQTGQPSRAPADEEETEAQK